MARETREQREARLAQELALAREKEEAFRKSMPAKMAALRMLAQSIGVSTDIQLNEFGPVVKFYDEISIDTELTYDSEQWRVEQLEETFMNIKAAQDEAARKKELAREIWDRMTTEEKVLIKDHIKYFWS